MQSDAGHDRDDRAAMSFEQLVLYQCLFELLWRDSQNNNVVVLKSFEAGTDPETISGIFGATLGINLDNTKTFGTLHLLTKAVKNGPPPYALRPTYVPLS
jgi:hypothetical protein